jgi:hypothetical protein
MPAPTLFEEIRTRDLQRWEVEFMVGGRVHG